MPATKREVTAAFEDWNRGFMDEASFGGEELPDLDDRVASLEALWRTPLDPSWIREAKEDHKWDGDGYRRGTERGEPVREAAIERDVLRHRRDVDCLGEEIVAGANAIPLCALGKKIEADLLLLTRSPAGYRQYLVEVKVEDRNPWFAVVEHLRQLRLFEASLGWRGFFARRHPDLQIPADLRTRGMILAPAAYYSAPKQKRNSVAPARRLIAALDVDVTLAIWSSGPQGMRISPVRS